MPTIELTLELERDGETIYASCRVKIHPHVNEAEFIDAVDDDTEEEITLTRAEQQRAEDRAWEKWCDGD